MKKKSTSYIASLNYQLHDINEKPNQHSLFVTVVSAPNRYFNRIPGLENPDLMNERCFISILKKAVALALTLKCK